MRDDVLNGNGSRQPHLVGVAISAHLNRLMKTPVSLPGLVKYLPISSSFVPFLCTLFLPLDEANAMMTVVAVEFATPTTRYNLF